MVSSHFFYDLSFFSFSFFNLVPIFIILLCVCVCGGGGGGSVANSRSVDRPALDVTGTIYK